MNNYVVKYKIATLAELIKGFVYKGYQFTAYDPNEYWRYNAWIASKNIEANTAGEARYKFINEITPLIEEFSLISQCAFRFVANTYIIYKNTNNEQKVVYVYYVRKTPSVGLHFDSEELSQLPKVDSIANKHSLLFISEAANAATFYTRTAMLVLAIEGLAGEITKNGKIMTNRVNTKEILGEELDKKLFDYGEGLRNILFHGKVKDHAQFEGLSDILYQKISDYMGIKYGINLQMVVHPQRNFYDNFEYTSNYWRYKEEPVLDIKTIEDALDDRSGRNQKEQSLFSLDTGDHKDY